MKRQFLQRSEVQGTIYEESHKIRFLILLPPNNFTYLYIHLLLLLLLLLCGKIVK
jgi:hypothetical protein